jgi:cell volume regulation protein A
MWKFKMNVCSTSILLIQVLVGVVFGFIFAFIAKFILSRINFKESGFDLAFIVAIAIMAYALPTLLQGNGYLAVYICGIVIGNSKVSSKKNMFNFFDGVTSIIQMFLFFLLGLLATPSELPNVALLGFLIALFLTIVARPLAVFISMLFFKAKFRQQMFVAWTGMRGVASIVFAIIAITNPAKIDNDIFHIVFFIVLFSISLQGSLLPLVAKKLDMIDYSDDVMKTFNDYLEEVPVEFLQFSLLNNHEWIGKRICEVIFPPESILVLIIRDNKRIIPNGNTILNEKDILIMSGKDSRKIEGINLYEKIVDSSDELINKKIKDISIKDKLIILIKRKNNVIIPKGDTAIYDGDILVINDTK